MASSYLQPVSRRRRAMAVALTILVHVLIVWLLLTLAPQRVPPPVPDDTLSAFDVAPAAQQDKTRQTRPEQARRAATPPVPPAPPPPPPLPIKQPNTVIWMNRDQFAATDLSKLVRPVEEGTETADTGADSKAPYGPGAGPGGRPLYRAEWYREPTNAELNTYLPNVPPGSWGEIACRTIDHYHVENCQTLGESPLGSKIATGMRRAAWQFLVRPPRRGGTPLIGSWVSIRIEFTEKGVEVPGGRD